MKRHQLVWEMIKIHISDGPFFMGSVANYPQVMVIKTDLRNVPAQGEPRPGRAGESRGSTPPRRSTTRSAYYWDNPDQHA